MESLSMHCVEFAIMHCIFAREYVVPKRYRLLPSMTGADHCVALTRAGGVLSWGSGQQGQLGRVGNRLSDRARLATQLAPHPVPFKRRRGVGARCAAGLTQMILCGGWSTCFFSRDIFCQSPVGSDMQLRKVITCRVYAEEVWPCCWRQWRLTRLGVSICKVEDGL